MALEEKLCFGNVVHERLLPKNNKFNYKIYYIALPLSSFDDLKIPHNKFAPLSFYDKDHGERDGRSLADWARHILKEYAIDKADGDIILICMPRILGYVFNPVSFWVCHDKQGNIRAILYEVNNTFGEHHTYLCAHTDQRIITADDTLKATKLFHVSPMLERAGHYTFRFKMDDHKLGVWINYYNGQNEKQLVTSLTGRFETLSPKTLKKAFWSYPLVTFKAIALIHWQALKILSKGIKYISKPKQHTETVSATTNVKKM